MLHIWDRSVGLLHVSQLETAVSQSDKRLHSLDTSLQTRNPFGDRLLIAYNIGGVVGLALDTGAYGENTCLESYKHNNILVGYYCIVTLN